MLNGFQFTSDDERFELRKTFDDGIVQYYSVWRVGKANAWLERLVDDNTQLHFARVTVAPSGMTLDGKNPEEPHTTWQSISNIYELSDLDAELDALGRMRMWHLQHGNDLICQCAMCRIDEVA